MKKNYVSPEIKVLKSALEGAVLADHSYGDADSKKGFFDDYEEDDAFKSNDLWDDNDSFGE